jgi:hypothetical protein
MQLATPTDADLPDADPPLKPIGVPSSVIVTVRASLFVAVAAQKHRVR